MAHVMAPWQVFMSSLYSSKQYCKHMDIIFVHLLWFTCYFPLQTADNCVVLFSNIDKFSKDYLLFNFLCEYLYYNILDDNFHIPKYHCCFGCSKSAIDVHLIHSNVENKTTSHKSTNVIWICICSEQIHILHHFAPDVWQTYHLAHVCLILLFQPTIDQNEQNVEAKSLHCYLVFYSGIPRL